MIIIPLQVVKKATNAIEIPAMPFIAVVVFLGEKWNIQLRSDAIQEI